MKELSKLSMKIYSVFDEFKREIYKLASDEYGEDAKIIIDAEFTASILAATCEMLDSFFGSEKTIILLEQMKESHKYTVNKLKDDKNG